MLSVIELAQLLTGALDEKFNIISRPAVVQVVSCLEAFNITHESYREVQNTRIIKDLQALRQNKANDQILAKRIKNLLRKWKERLASTVAPPVTSHPNSPQNISQGSSDTQFMTQQSQSPPISQPPLNHQKAVNGPTTFSNVLTKPPNYPQNHIQMAVTTPVPIPYQNGSQEPASVLGKRKFDNADMDENSNHSKRKQMKRSNDFGAISSPLNNSSINHNHLPTPPVPAPAPQPQPQLPPVDAPKKRGRKKGSKGIDSMLNGSTIPDFQAEIKQKIALSTGKRNKTTMEIQQMLESHQNTASSLSWTNGDVDSSSLDRGFHSNSSFHAPETSHDGFVKKLKQEVRVKEEPVSISEPVASTSQPQPVAPRSLTIEDEIAQLRAQLPPIDYEAAALDNFDEYNTIDEYGEAVECTCTFKEVITYLGAEETGAVESGKPPPVVPKQESDDDDDETDDFCAVEDVDDDVISLPPRSRGAVQSIFDPEYDANENVIEEMVVRRKPVSKVIEVKVDKQAVKVSRMEPLLEAPPPEILDRIPVTNYECEEDPMCPARAHFQRDPVTRFEVERLNKTHVVGVNGFWNGIPEEKPEQDYSKDLENIDYEKHRLWKRVVPRYNFLTLDKIPKTFDDDSPYSMPPPPLESALSGKPSNGDAKKSDIEFREWHELMNVRSYNDEVLTILPYVIID